MVDWVKDLITELQNIVKVHCVNNNLLEIRSLKVHLVSKGESYPEAHLGEIVLHEDIYRRSPLKVVSRVKSLAGLNDKRVYARNTTVVRLSSQKAQKFIDQNHLMGYGGGKTFLGLAKDHELVAVAVFSKVVFMKFEEPAYNSVELTRFCSLPGTTVIGGLGKLIQAYIKDFNTDDIVTSIDKEWSSGRSYLQLGFEFVEQTEPLQFKVNNCSWERRVIGNADSFSSNEKEYIVQNSGNIKLRFIV